MAWPCSRFQEPTLKSPTETCHHLHTVAFSTDNFSTFSLLNQMPQVARLKYCRLELTWSSTLIPGEDNGTPLQYSCLENPWMEEPGRLQSMGSQRVGCDWATSLSLWLLWIELLWTFLNKQFCRHLLSSLLGKYLGVEWLELHLCGRGLWCVCVGLYVLIRINN